MRDPGLRWSGDVAGPRDQRPVESRDDVLVFTSEPLAAPLQWDELSAAQRT